MGNGVTQHNHHAPLWMIASTVLNRAGGFLIILILGHGFAPDVLADYFAALVAIGVAVSFAQAGCGPLLVRLAQYRQSWSVALIVMVRVTIASIAIALIAPTLPPRAWPVLIMPLAASLSPDWLVSARLQFNKILLIGALGQVAGIMVALYAAILTTMPAWLYATAPAISLTSGLASLYFALGKTNTAAPSAATSPRHLPAKRWPQLIIFTLLAGLLPNIDMALLPASLPSGAQNALLLVHRVLLISAALIAAISSVLFAQNRQGGGRDKWLLWPALGMAMTLIIFPQLALTLLFGHSGDAETGLLRMAAFWPLLLALVSRQFLVLQEQSGHFRTACLAGLILLTGAVIIPLCESAANILMAMNIKLAFLAIALHLAGRFQPVAAEAPCRN